MSAGTLTLTNNSTAVTGSGTTFTTDLKAGDFITATIGGILYTLPVETVTSNTAAVLTSAYTGPTQSGAAWVAVPRKTMNQLTADLVTQATSAIRGFNFDKMNWQQFYSGTGDITVTLPDGTTVNGPSWPKMAGLTTGAIQWRGSIPANSNINNYGPTSAYTGAWGQASVSISAADLANGYPAADSGVLQVFPGGAFGCTQTYTTSGGRFFVRRLAAAWNASSPSWSAWLEIGGLSSNVGLPASVTTLADSTYFAQNQTYVLSGTRTDSPVGLTAGQSNAIIMSVRRAGGTIMGLHQTLFTPAGTYERYGAPNAATGWTSVTWYAGGDANGWRLVGADAMAALGIGLSNATVLPSFDWQQADFPMGSLQVVQFNNMSNTPAGVTYGDTTTVTIESLQTRVGTLSLVKLTPMTAVTGNKREYTIVISGAKGSRTFTVAQNFNSDSSTVIPVANGGTGQSTQSAALTALLGASTVPLANGGTGSSTQSGAQTNLGLVKQGGANDTTAGRLLTVGAFGLGTSNPLTIPQDSRIGFGAYLAKMVLGGLDNNVSVVSVPFDSNTSYQMVIPTILATAPRMYLRLLSSDSTNNGRVCEVYTTTNTTKAADGTLKAASPIVHVFHNGDYEVNDESDGCVVTRLGVGEYLIEGCMGLNSDAGWSGTDGGFDIPKDRNRQPLVWLDYEVNPDGSILVKTYHRTYPDAPPFARNIIGTRNEDGSITETVKNGDPIDIPSDQFISVRVEMPEDCAYNQKMAEAARIQAERDAERLRAEAEALAASEEAEALYQVEMAMEAARIKAEEEVRRMEEEEAQKATDEPGEPDMEQ